MSDNESRRLLLAEVFGEERFRPPYLDWQYRQNPDGQEIAIDEISAGHCRGHYAVIPQLWSNGTCVARLALSLNTAIGEEFRGKGLFTTLADAAYRHAEAEGITGIVGVANGNSTPGFLKRLGFKLIGPMPVQVGLTFPWAFQAKSYEATAFFLESHTFADICASISQSGWQVVWNIDRLRWRLSSPHARYHIHVTPDGIGITRCVQHAGLPFTALLKVLPRHSAPTVKIGPILRAAAWVHRTPLFLHAGWNNSIRITGIAVPARLKPSPLNLIYKSLRENEPIFSGQRHFEFLDFDAY